MSAGGCDIESTGGLYLIDTNPENSGGDSGNNINKAWVIGGVCWTDGDGISDTDADCDQGSDVMIASGAWAEATYVDIGSKAGLTLVTNGNNDDGVTDWQAIPEFSTLLMPIASVLLIVGYNYRRKSETSEN